MASLFKRLNEGRPPPTEKTTKHITQENADQKTLLRGVLANGPVPATIIEERGAAHGFSKKQLRCAKSK